MSGHLVHSAPPVHHCNPAVEIREEPYPGRPASEGTAKWIHDLSANFRHGDVWECDDCGRRWTLVWAGRVARGGSVRVLPNSGDWVAESKRVWKKRLKAKGGHHVATMQAGSAPSLVSGKRMDDEEVGPMGEERRLPEVRG